MAGKDKSRKSESFSQWAKRNKDFLKNAKIRDPAPQDDKNWRKRPAYKQWRQWCLLRDDYHCQMCGETKDLTVHHIIPATICPELKYDIRNGITVCRPCHETKSDVIHQMKPRFWNNLKRKRRR